jgi:hypothetical protein
VALQTNQRYVAYSSEQASGKAPSAARAPTAVKKTRRKKTGLLRAKTDVFKGQAEAEAERERERR